MQPDIRQRIRSEPEPDSVMVAPLLCILTNDDVRKIA